MRRTRASIFDVENMMRTAPVTLPSALVGTAAYTTTECTVGEYLVPVAGFPLQRVLDLGVLRVVEMLGHVVRVRERPARAVDHGHVPPGLVGITHDARDWQFGAGLERVLDRSRHGLGVAFGAEDQAVLLTMAEREPQWDREEGQAEDGDREIGDDEAPDHRVVSEDHVEPVTDAADRRDPRGITELLAQGRDVDVERLRRAPPVLVPDLLDELVATNHNPGVVGEPGEQIELLGRERDLVAVDAHAAARAGRCARRRALALATLRVRSHRGDAVRRRTARMRATSSRKPNGFTT